MDFSNKALAPTQGKPLETAEMKLGKASFLEMRRVPVANTAGVKHLPSPFCTKEKMPRKVKSWNPPTEKLRALLGEVHRAGTENISTLQAFSISRKSSGKEPVPAGAGALGMQESKAELQASPGHKVSQQHKGLDTFGAVSRARSQRKLPHHSWGCLCSECSSDPSALSAHAESFP